MNRTSAPAVSASWLVVNAGRSAPASRGSSALAGSPASESEPSATGSSSGCASTRSSVSCPVYPAQPRIAAVGIGIVCQKAAIYAVMLVGGPNSEHIRGNRHARVQLDDLRERVAVVDAVRPRDGAQVRIVQVEEPVAVAQRFELPRPDR